MKGQLMTMANFLTGRQAAQLFGVDRTTVWRYPERYKPDIYITDVPIGKVLQGEDPLTKGQAHPGWTPEPWDGPTVFYSLRSIAKHYEVPTHVMRRYLGTPHVVIGESRYGWEHTVLDTIPNVLPEKAKANA